MRAVLLLASLGLLALAAPASATRNGFDDIGAELARGVQHTSDTLRTAEQMGMPLVDEALGLAVQGLDHLAAQASAAWPPGR